MKRFAETFIICLIVVEVFFLFGGLMLFDFSRSVYLPGVAIAFVLAILMSYLGSQQRQIEELEKRIGKLETEGQAEGHAELEQSNQSHN